jgi:hypothetical protein
MKSTTLRRLGAAVIAPALATGMIVAAPSAQAAPNSYAYSAARWLSDQLTDGVVHNEQYDFDDYGLSLDIFFALEALDTRAGDRAEIIAAFEADPTVYTGAGLEAYAGQTGKLATAVQAAGRDATSFGGRDLVADAEARVGATGRAADQSQYGDYSNSIGQSWVVRALTIADSPRADETVDYLLKQQCSDGSFRSAMADVACMADAGTIDATAFAVQALDVAQDAGVANLQDDIDDAVSWLLQQQAADGSFVNDGEANTNSTGLAASTLATVGQTGAAGSAASWIVSHQVTDAVAEDTALSNEIGAIAFDQAALTAAKGAGITVAQRDQWVRAAAQAAVGVNSQLGQGSFAVTAATGFVAGGSRIAVSATGLAPREKFAAAVSGGASVHGTANAAGVASASIKLPGGTATRTLTITGSRATRTGAQTVKVLGSRRLRVSFAKSTVKKGTKQSVKVSRLAPGEKVTVYVSNKRIKTAKANASGRYTLTFKPSRKAGKKTLKIVGQYKNRTVSKSFKVK